VVARSEAAPLERRGAAVEVDVVSSLADARRDVSRLRSSCGAFLSPHRLLDLEADRRWEATYLVAEQDGRAVALLPVFRCRADSFPDRAYDPRRFAPEGGGDPSDWLLAGGRADFAGGLLRDPEAEDVAAAAARAILRRLAALARETGARPVALYVSELEEPFFPAAFGLFGERHELYTDYVFSDLPPTHDEFVAALGSKRRNTFRNDRLAVESLGLETTTAAWPDVLDEAGELVLAVKARHGVPDHADLVRERLARWLAHPEIDPVAFATRLRGRLIGVHFAWQYGQLFQTYELGLAGDEGPVRLAAYIDLLVHAPLRTAIERGCRELSLGLGAKEPKRSRGAVKRGVWALG
jgi:Acetyltransferase (GNAT) domain